MGRHSSCLFFRLLLLAFTAALPLCQGAKVECPSHWPDLDCYCGRESLSCSGSFPEDDPELLESLLTVLKQDSLTSISLSIPGLPPLPASSFSPSGKLKHFTLANSNYSHLNPDVFSGLSLNTLNLKFNSFSSVPSSSLGHLDQLESLDLSFNRIAIIGEGDLAGMSSLKRLDLSHNAITRIAPGVFSDFPDLIELMLQENFIEVLEQDTFVRLTKLKTLFLASNLLSHPDGRVFSPLAKLESLYLGHNPLEALPRLELPSLKTLCLKNCSLCCNIQEGSFSGLSQLGMLTMSHNNIIRVDLSGFSPLTELLLLDLSHNNLSSLEKGVFFSARTLTDLELQHNSLETLRDGVFSGLHRLETVNLGDNLLSSWGCGHSADLPALRELNLERNAFSSLSAGPFTLLPHLARLQLQGNRFQCDCGLWGLAKFLHESRLPSHSKQSAECSEPEDWAGTKVAYLWLDCPEVSNTCRNSPELRIRLQALLSQLRLEILGMSWESYLFIVSYSLVGVDRPLPVEPVCRLTGLEGNLTALDTVMVPCPSPRSRQQTFKLPLLRLHFSAVCISMELAPGITLENCSLLQLKQPSNGLQTHLMQLLPNITVHLEASESDGTALLRWTVSDMDPPDTCRLKVVIILEGDPPGTRHEKHHPCKNGSEYLSVHHPASACFTVTYPLLDRHLTQCSDFPPRTPGPVPTLTVPLYPIIGVSSIFALALIIIIVLLVKVTCQKRSPSRQSYKVHFGRDPPLPPNIKVPGEEEVFLSSPSPGMTTFLPR